MNYELPSGEVITIELDPSKKHFLLMSGGFDSAVLLCLLAIESARTGVNIQPAINIGSGSLMLASAIVSYVNEKYGTTIPLPISMGDSNAHHTKKTQSIIDEITKTEELGMAVINQRIWQAINEPPNVVLGDMDGTPGYRPIRAKPKSELMVSPFAALDKSQIVYLAHELGVLEPISSLSSSCTNKMPSGARCQKCFQCTERAWAFRTQGLTDAGNF